MHSYHELEAMARAERLGLRSPDERQELRAPFSLKGWLHRQCEKPGQSPGEALAEAGIELIIDILEAVF